MLGGVVHALDVVDSTQTALGRLARAGAPAGTVVAARHQTAGRGRRGHHWWDDPGASLLCSILLRPTVPAPRAPELALVAGIAVTDVLRAAQMPAEIRWPNDVLVQGRKIAGVLAEAVCHPDGTLAHVLLGIGMNLEQQAFPADIAARATSVRLVSGRAWHARDVLDALLTALDDRYREWSAGGFAALRAVWRERTGSIGSLVTVPGRGQGTAVDVDATGALLVELANGEMARVVSAVLGE